VKPLIVDALASGKGVKHSTHDVIGAGPRAVAGVLEAKGLDTDIQPVEQFLKEGPRSEAYDVLFISGMTSDMTAIRKAVKKWRKIRGGPVIIGGPAASEPIKVLRRTGGDIAITGEGEYTLAELLEGGLIDGRTPVNLSEVKGISYVHGEEIRVNPFRPIQPKTVFTQYSPSTHTITDYPLYKSSRVYVEVVRGCSNFYRARIGKIGERCINCEQCTELELEKRYDCPVGIPPGCGYCSVPSLYGPPKSRPSDRIIEEVSELLKYGVHRIILSAPGFLDYQREALVEPKPLTDPRNPEPNYEAIEELLSGLTNLPQVKAGKASIMIENLKASLVTERAARLLGKYLRGTPVNIGFETGSESHSKLLGRPSTPQETLEAIRRLRRAGMKLYVYFIHGLPGQSVKTVNETIDMIKKSVKAGSDRVILYRFHSLPLTAFSQCPSAPPTSRDPQSRRVFDAAQEANRGRKKALIGQVLKVVIAERYDKNPRYWIAYPLNHGPVVLLEGEGLREGDLLFSRILDIANDRMMYGEVVKSEVGASLP